MPSPGDRHCGLPVQPPLSATSVQQASGWPILANAAAARPVVAGASAVRCDLGPDAHRVVGVAGPQDSRHPRPVPLGRVAREAGARGRRRILAGGSPDDQRPLPGPGRRTARTSEPRHACRIEEQEPAGPPRSRGAGAGPVALAGSAGGSWLLPQPAWESVAGRCSPRRNPSGEPEREDAGTNGGSRSGSRQAALPARPTGFSGR